MVHIGRRDSEVKAAGGLGTIQALTALMGKLRPMGGKPESEKPAAYACD